MLTLAALFATFSSAHADTYTLDPASSRLYVVVRNDTSAFASRLGHDHVISAESFTGTVNWDVANAGACAVDISFPVTALRVDPGNLRSEAKLDPDGAVGESSKETITTNYSSKRQLWSSSFPTISYQATSCDGTTGKVNVTGNLTIRGASKQITVPMTVEVSGDSFRGRGKFTATHEDFGFSPFSNLGGALRNLTKLEFVVDVRGSKS